MSAPIMPIKNLYYLFLYAWDLFPQGRAIELRATEGPGVADLFAKVLINGARRLFRRGLDRGYVSIVEETTAPRGRFLLGDTVKRNAILNARIVCLFDELTTDVIQNQIIKATMRELTCTESVRRDLVHELKMMCNQLSFLSDVQLSLGIFRQVQLSRNNREYELLLRICKLVAENLLPGEGSRSTKFADILEDEVRMSAVFESFMRNFYRTEQRRYQVAREELEWDAVCKEPWQSRHLPKMQTDVTLRAGNHVIVLDAKFSKETLVRRQGGEKKAQSAHLYQMLSYLEHTQQRYPGCSVEGILVYPEVNQERVRLDYLLCRRRIRICTVSFQKGWQEIHSELMALIGVG